MNPTGEQTEAVTEFVMGVSFSKMAFNYVGMSRFFNHYCRCDTDWEMAWLDFMRRDLAGTGSSVFVKVLFSQAFRTWLLLSCRVL